MQTNSKNQIDITLNYVQNHIENQYFDRKQAKISLKDVAPHISAFANANGGYLIIGIADNGEVTGFNREGSNKLNDLLKVPYDFCIPVPRYTYTVWNVTNKYNEEDHVLVFNIQASNNKIIKTKAAEVFLRIGDSSKKLTYEQIRDLEYDKGERLYEDEIVERSSIKDIDTALLTEYKNIFHSKLTDEEILDARGFLVDGKLTVAGILLFGKAPDKYLLQAKVRFIRYEGIESQTGVAMNIIKDQTFYSPLHKVIEEMKSLIAGQLRDFQSLNPRTGKFRVVPEYPEFAWQEGLVNAVTHRDYSIKGEHIKIFMYDDRLEIDSPGHLPNIVNTNNLKHTRYSRNPKIARILSEFGWVKELNEGVKRIYEEMSNYFLDEPEFRELDKNIFQLKLRNNIIMRKIRNTEQLAELLPETTWTKLSAQEKTIIELVYQKRKLTVKFTADILSRSLPVARKLLNELMKKGILTRHRLSPKDPTQYYTFAFFDMQKPISEEISGSLTVTKN